jgi:ketosteroid isomerase-like protein
MTTSDKINVALKFVEAINAADINSMTNLMSEDHIFIDSGDTKNQGMDFMKQAWISFFQLFPDYRIDVTDITENKSVVGIFGFAGGTYEGFKDDTGNNSFRIPASWKAVVDNNKTKNWQVYRETKTMESLVD